MAEGLVGGVRGDEDDKPAVEEPTASIHSSMAATKTRFRSAPGGSCLASSPANSSTPQTGWHSKRRARPQRSKRRELMEHMETYVAEAVAREQLDKDPKLAQVFSHRLADDPAFAADPEPRLAFFTQRHPSFDERLRLYPVLGVDPRHPSSDNSPLHAIPVSATSTARAT